MRYQRVDAVITGVVSEVVATIALVKACAASSARYERVIDQQQALRKLVTAA